MTFKRSPGVLLCLFMLPAFLIAQDKSGKFGKISSEDFHLPKTDIIDSSTSAVILADQGSTSFVGNKQGWVSYVFKRQRRIRIINKKAFDLATVHIPLYVRDEHAEKVDNLNAVTYNLENGVITETKLDKTGIFDDKLDKNHLEKKFTMPAVKEGSIIEYSYTIISDFYFNIPEWQFQSIEYPTLWSEYEISIPRLVFYVSVRHGIHPFCIDKTTEGHDSYLIRTKPAEGSLQLEGENLTVSSITDKHHWAMKDIPAFKTEDYLTTPVNYADKIEFQLSHTYNGSEIQDEMNSWKKATEQLLKKEDFGQPLQEDNYWLNDMLQEIGSKATDLEQAKAVYYYVSSHFACTNYNWPFIKTTLRDFVKKRNGTVGDVNLLLIALLRQKRIDAEPVLLSTREHGFNPPSYPVIDRLNYVICRTRINNHIYYLDAAHPGLGFGQLPGNCYNGHARIISEKDSASIYFEPDSLRERKLTMVIIANTNNKGALEGSYQSTLGNQESYNTREKIIRSGKKEYFKSIQTAWGEDLSISNPDIDSLDQPENPVKIHYDFSMKHDEGAPIIYFNPLFTEAYRENPFKASERKYPVEMSYTFDDTYVLNMDIPDGYTVDELPKSVRVAYNGNEGLFEYIVMNTNNSIQLRCRVRLDRAEFAPEDYSSLRDFFGFIVKKESEDIVLKKKN